MTALELARERRERIGRKRRRDWFRSMMDCGDEMCGECRVCRHHNFEEWVGMVAGGVPHSVRYDPDVLAYLARKDRK